MRKHKCMLCGKRHGNPPRPCPYASGVAFTEKMLKNLRGHVVACGDCQTCVEMGLGRLLARLDAAEAYILAEPADRWRYYMRWAESGGRE